MATILEKFESQLSLKPSSIKIEIMIETPQALVSQLGSMAIPALIKAAQGRCLRIHLGPYDYTSSLGIAAQAQDLTHPSLNFARAIMQICLASTGIDLVDGPTNIIPLEPHTSQEEWTTAQSIENTTAVHNAWRISYRNIRHALKCGFYQGWDLHPAQLPVRYAASYEFFLESLEPTTKRLLKFLKAAGQTSVHRGAFDDAASARTLLNHVRRAYNSGAIGEIELAKAGLDSSLLSTTFANLIKSKVL